APRQRHVRVLERLDGAFDVGRIRADLGVQVTAVEEVRDAVAEQVPRRQVIPEARVRLDLTDARRAGARLYDLDASLHGADQRRDLGDVEAACEPVLQRLEEELLPREPV